MNDNEDESMQSWQKCAFSFFSSRASRINRRTDRRMYGWTKRESEPKRKKEREKMLALYRCSKVDRGTQPPSTSSPNPAPPPPHTHNHNCSLINARFRTFNISVTDQRTDGWMDGRTDGRMDGWTDRPTDGWTEKVRV